MSSNYDLIVIGAGNAGQAAAGIAREAGWSVLVVESRDVGGTCPLRGCVPKKVLVAAGETLDAIARAPIHRIRVGKPKTSSSYEGICAVQTGVRAAGKKASTTLFLPR
jgi:glutathione reductase (NADPH)